jgi:hypothetical protein
MIAHVRCRCMQIQTGPVMWSRAINISQQQKQQQLIQHQQWLASQATARQAALVQAQAQYQVIRSCG